MFLVKIEYGIVKYEGILLNIRYNDMNENISGTHEWHYDITILVDGVEMEFKFLNGKYIEIYEEE